MRKMTEAKKSNENRKNKGQKQKRNRKKSKLHQRGSKKDKNLKKSRERKRNRKIYPEKKNNRKQANKLRRNTSMHAREKMRKLNSRKVFKGMHCDYIDLSELKTKTANGCDSGMKFVIKVRGEYHKTKSTTKVV